MGKYKQKTEESQAAEKRKRPSPGQIGLGTLLAGAGIVAGSLLYAYIATHPPRRRMRMPDDSETMELEEVEFQARDSIRLSGWFSSHKNARGVIICCHGHTGNRLEVLSQAKLFQAEGFHTLLFDFRATGLSGGNLTTIGYHEIQDLLGALDYIESRAEAQGLPIGVFGISMGGAVAIMTAAQDDRIRAVATHGAYATLERAIRQRGRLLFGPLGPVLTRPAMWWGRRWLPEHPRDVSPLAAVASLAPRPIFLSHGVWDKIVPVRDGQALYAAAQEPKALHILQRSWHIRIAPDILPDYERALVTFFCENLQ